LNSQRLAWVRRLALLAVFCFAGLTSYVLDRLVDLQARLGEDEGESVVWAVSQALYQSSLVLQTSQLASVEDNHRGRLAMQQQLLKGRLRILRDTSMSNFLLRAEAWSALEQAIRMADEPQPDYVALQQLLRDIGNRVMQAERDEKGARRDAHKALMWQLMFSVVGMVLSGAVLCWQLLRSLRRAEQFNTEVVRQHEQARRLVDALEQERSVRQRYQDFVSLMSHQLRTPLAVIDSSAQRLIRQGGTQDVEGRTQRIRKSVDQLNQLIVRVLEGMRVDHGLKGASSLALEAVTCTWRDVLEEVLESQREILGTRRVLLRWPCGDSLELRCDPVWCREVVGNLLSNAHKYSPSDLPIEIESRVDSGWLHCSVRDHGKGIPAGEIEHVFERFYRGCWSNVTPGIGLGLPIARTLAEWHGGRIEAANADAGGAVFTLRLPVSAGMDMDAFVAGGMSP